jgi:hypothetical protein
MRIVLMALLGLAAASASAQPLITVTPSATHVAAVGETVTVDIEISEYEDLRGFSIVVLYNQAALRHAAVAQGNVFSLAGGPGGIFLATASNPADGYILADGARIGGGGATGTQARLFRITFEAVGPGATDIYFGEILLRDSDNAPLAFETAPGVAAVESPLPDASHTAVRQPGSAGEAFEAQGATRLAARFHQAGTAQLGKLTSALYDTAPPGGSGQPFDDPDGWLEHLHATDAYWEVTSSLAGPYRVDLAFSYAGLSGPADPHQYRVASRALASQAGELWHVIPLSRTTVDPAEGFVRVDGLTGEGLAAQYALVFDGPVNAEQAPTPLAPVVASVFPHPIASRATVAYELPAGGPVVIRVTDMLGRRVATLRNEYQSAGSHVVEWRVDGLAPGGYVVHVAAGGAAAARRVVVAR